MLIILFILFVAAWILIVNSTSSSAEPSEGNGEAAGLRDAHVVGHRVLVFVVNAVGMGLHAWAAQGLEVSPDHVLDGFHSRGPGEGLYFMFFLLLPWLFALVINVPLARACVSSWRAALPLWLLVVTTWLLLLGVEDALWPTCPEGVRCVAS